MAINTVTQYLNDLDASTKEAEIDALMDARDIITPTWDLLYKNKKTQSGGQFLTQPLEYERSPGGFLSPYGTMRTEHKEQYTKAIYEWCIAYTAAGIPKKDLYLNSGSSQVFDLALQKRASAKKSLINLMSYNVFSDHTETLNVNNQISLSSYFGGVYDVDGDRMEGFYFAISDGTNGYTGDYGRISATNRTWWQSQIVNAANKSPANKFTIKLNQEILSKCNRGAVNVSYCPMGYYYWDRFQTLIGPQQNLNDPALAELGYESIKKNGCVYYLEPYADNSGSSDSLYYWTPSRYKFMCHPQVDFLWTGWKEGYDQWAVVGFYILMGNFVSNNRMNLGKVINLNKDSDQS